MFKVSFILILLFIFLILGLTMKKSMIYVLLMLPFLVLSFVPTTYVPALLVNTPLGSYRPSFILTVALIIAFLVAFRINFSLVRAHRGLLLFTSLLFLVDLLSCFLNTHNITSVASTVYTFVFSFGILFYVLIQGKHINALSAVKFAIVVSAIVSFLGILEFFGVQPYLDLYRMGGHMGYNNNTSFDRLHRVVSSLGNPLILSAFLLLCLPIIFYLRESQQKKMFWNFALILHFAAIVLTMSRSAILVAIILVIYSLRQMKLKSFLKFHFIIGVFLCIAYFVFNSNGFNESFLDRLFFKTQSESYAYRSQAFGAVVEILKANDPFLGIGPGNVNEYLKNELTGLVPSNTLDNGFLDVLGRSGVIGFIVFIAILIILLKTFNQMEKPLRYVGHGLLIVIVGMAFSFDVIHYESVWGVFWFFTGLLCVYNNKSLSSNQSYLTNIGINLETIIN